MTTLEALRAVSDYCLEAIEDLAPLEQPTPIDQGRIIAFDTVRRLAETLISMEEGKYLVP